MRFDDRVRGHSDLIVDSEDGGRGHKLRNAGSLWRLEKARKQILS